mmetsp:Transcript_28756/g.72112  ORF Transcript_28756/g.72112 Transcript_28756/m.72112 type:complete len:654 (+) Transcript_28756:21-1982(+)
MVGYRDRVVCRGMPCLEQWRQKNIQTAGAPPTSIEWRHLEVTRTAAPLRQAQPRRSGLAAALKEPPARLGVSALEGGLAAALELAVAEVEEARDDGQRGVVVVGARQLAAFKRGDEDALQVHRVHARGLCVAAQLRELVLQDGGRLVAQIVRVLRLGQLLLHHRHPRLQTAHPRSLNLYGRHQPGRRVLQGRQVRGLALRVPARPASQRRHGIGQTLSCADRVPLRRRRCRLGRCSAGRLHRASLRNRRRVPRWLRGRLVPAVGPPHQRLHLQRGASVARRSRLGDSGPGLAAAQARLERRHLVVACGHELPRLGAHAAQLALQRLGRLRVLLALRRGALLGGRKRLLRAVQLRLQRLELPGQRLRLGAEPQAHRLLARRQLGLKARQPLLRRLAHRGRLALLGKQVRLALLRRPGVLLQQPLHVLDVLPQLPLGRPRGDALALLHHPPHALRPRLAVAAAPQHLAQLLLPGARRRRGARPLCLRHRRAVVGLLLHLAQPRLRVRQQHRGLRKLVLQPAACLLRPLQARQVPGLPRQLRPGGLQLGRQRLPVSVPLVALLGQHLALGQLLPETVPLSLGRGDFTLQAGHLPGRCGPARLHIRLQRGRLTLQRLHPALRLLQLGPHTGQLSLHVLILGALLLLDPLQPLQARAQ